MEDIEVRGLSTMKI